MTSCVAGVPGDYPEQITREPSLPPITIVPPKHSSLSYKQGPAHLNAKKFEFTPARIETRHSVQTILPQAKLQSRLDSIQSKGEPSRNHLHHLNPLQSTD